MARATRAAAIFDRPHGQEPGICSWLGTVGVEPADAIDMQQEFTMNSPIIRLCTLVLFASAFTSAAHAEYRCDPAPTLIDQQACEAAKQGPDALRRFVNRMDHQMSSLLYADYVDGNTERVWDSKPAVAKQPEEEDSNIQIASWDEF